ncbi:Type II secretory pathway, ATPase PulE/Tfp pilus assembly pathway, ATPase PilB [Enhygromyxa salina]|uniref:Type II secretory pathway, ATPase PulE/Tfp pilus assembly pathway, ATPase PilB n=1 Tax=Enhygromyxa salina TaxID=215803 RepID=A0A0C1ZNC2_9BACT|nr:hypothetical protein [Enhygromyxa salina]KIG18969.1 Type II secretory pathway, ATPase PulE/Tfp pilus assembly pathway, ATPase PilB [Enhygromyxa salina]
MVASHTPEQAIWEKLYERFDPEQPAFKPGWRVERKYSPARDIASELARPMGGHKRFMLLGGIGSGKSTELLGVAETRSADGPVIFVDLVGHFENTVGDATALQRVQPWEVLLLVGLAVVHAGTARFGQMWPKELLRRFDEVGREFTDDDNDQPSFDAAKLASTVAVLAGGAVGTLVGGPVGAGVGAGLVAAGTAGAGVQWRFKLGIPGRRARSDQDARVQRLLDVVNKLLGELQAHGSKLAVFVDGLDRIADRDRIRALFVESALLGSLECDVVLTGPIALHWGSLRKHVRKFTTKILTNAPVVRRDDPWSWEPGGPGVTLCVEVYRRRTADLPSELIPVPLLHKLAYYSGGRLREFVRLVRELSGPAWDRSLTQADEQVVNHAIDRMREETEAGLTKAHLNVLRELLRDPSELPNHDLVEEMLDVCLILPYPNESEWYLPHPLLLKAKLPKPG